MVLSFVFAIVGLWAATPQAAVLAAYAPAHGAVVVRTNRASRYAVVFTHGGSLDGERNETPVLVERFSFGWQPIDLVDAPCRIDALGVAPGDRAALRAGVGRDRARTPCAGFRKDVGNAARVAEIRRIAPGPITSFAAVSGDYGCAAYYGAGGREVLYERRGGAWHVLPTGGAALSFREAVALGIPPEAARAFGLPLSFASVVTKRPQRVSH